MPPDARRPQYRTRRRDRRLPEPADFGPATANPETPTIGREPCGSTSGPRASAAATSTCCRTGRRRSRSATSSRATSTTAPRSPSTRAVRVASATSALIGHGHLCRTAAGARARHRARRRHGGGVCRRATGDRAARRQRPPRGRLPRRAARDRGARARRSPASTAATGSPWSVPAASGSAPSRSPGRSGCEVGLVARHEPQRVAGERLGATTASGEYDVVVEAAGTESALAQAADLCRPSGTVLFLSTHWTPVPIPGFPAAMKELTFRWSFMSGNHPERRPRSRRRRRAARPATPRSRRRSSRTASRSRTRPRRSASPPTAARARSRSRRAVSHA